MDISTTNDDRTKLQQPLFRFQHPSLPSLSPSSHRLPPILRHLRYDCKYNILKWSYPAEFAKLFMKIFHCPYHIFRPYWRSFHHHFYHHFNPQFTYIYMIQSSIFAKHWVPLTRILLSSWLTSMHVMSWTNHSSILSRHLSLAWNRQNVIET